MRGQIKRGGTTKHKALVLFHRTMKEDESFFYSSWFEREEKKMKKVMASALAATLAVDRMWQQRQNNL